jgi:hypothetical protein
LFSLFFLLVFSPHPLTPLPFYFLVFFVTIFCCSSSFLSPCYIFFSLMSVGTFSLEQEKDLEKHCTTCYNVLATLVSNKITM